MFKKLRKSKINQRIFRSAKKIGLVFFSLFLILSMGKISGTNSFFMDTATSAGNTMTAGVWIPEITVTADHAPDGDDGWYQPAPCFTVASTISDVTIFWTLTGDHPTLNGSFPYPGACVNIPEGIWTLSVYAQNNANSDWKSATTTQDYKVDTNNPVAEITAPIEGATVSGSVSIKGTVSDLYIKSYRLQITGPDNYDSGYIATPGFTDSWIRTWDTSAVARGDYQIKITARDLAGHETSDEIGVTVVKAGDVVINEIMWMGSDGDGDDEWIELKNMTGDTVDLSNWNIMHGGSGAGGHIEIPNGYSIKPHEFFLITRKKWDETKINLGDDLNKDEGYTHVSGMSLNNNGEDLILQDKSANTIDTAWKSSGDWPAGYENDSSNHRHQSMERNNIPSDGTLSGSWHTCTDSACNDTTYWDSEGNNYGTPRHANLSKNDPSDENYDPEEDKTAVEEELTEPIIPIVAAPVSDTVPADEESEDPEPATEDPAVVNPIPPVDPEITPEVKPEVMPEVAPETTEKPAVVEEKPVVEEEKPADVLVKKEEIKKDEAAKPDDNSGDDKESDSSANPAN